MSQLNDYLTILWDSIVTNLYGFYYYFIADENKNEKSDVQMKKFVPIKSTKEYREELEFIIGKEIKKDISEKDLLDYINIEIQYVNKKMSMSRTISQVNVDDIVLKTKLINLFQDIKNQDFYVEEITEIINY